MIKGLSLDGAAADGHVDFGDFLFTREIGLVHRLEPSAAETAAAVAEIAGPAADTQGPGHNAFPFFPGGVFNQDGFGLFQTNHLLKNSIFNYTSFSVGYKDLNDFILYVKT